MALLYMAKFPMWSFSLLLQVFLALLKKMEAITDFLYLPVVLYCCVTIVYGFYYVDTTMKKWQYGD